MATKIFTIGHSTRPLVEFLDLLEKNGVNLLVDIRTIARSRHNPQYEQIALEKSLPKHGISYMHKKELGGLRPKVKNSINMGWHNESFRNYADYMQTEEFVRGVDDLITLAKQQTTAIMCAEAVPWRCHRSLVGDALLVRGVSVLDIMSATSVKEHALTSFAVAHGKNITYPIDKTDET